MSCACGLSDLALSHQRSKGGGCNQTMTAPRRQSSAHAPPNTGAHVRSRMRCHLTSPQPLAYAYASERGGSWKASRTIKGPAAGGTPVTGHIAVRARAQARARA
ncbi:hypothetical protein RJ55_03338 [Drechmeria coniospora]|nr:hypothetical protein RJ55_03338 [Drechmeria coniospora]